MVCDSCYYYMGSLKIRIADSEHVARIMASACLFFVGVAVLDQAQSHVWIEHSSSVLKLLTLREVPPDQWCVMVSL